MMEETQGRQCKRKRLWLALTAAVAILAILIVPPLVSVSHYKSRITQLVSTSLGRPVRMSSVEVRLLPRPGFVLNDLAVEEDPAFGAEPIFHANTVTASIRLLPLWRGRLEIGSISADEASLNLVRTADGHWNLDSLLRTATARAQSAEGGAGLVTLPYIEAKNSRINIKNGVEKLPFSLLDAKMSLEQLRPGDWRVRLRGQPARTDLSLELADTGIVRLEATLHQAPNLRQVPMHVDLEWREAQLGQLTRLVLGTDAGWRGDLTGELRLDGTAESAQIKAQLRATGVHRAEFAPAAPMDFDANCSLVAHYSTHAIDNLACDSPLGSGHIRLTGNVPASEPGLDALPHFSVELDRIPVAAGLDALRTVRSGLDTGLVAAGLVSGKITYAPTAAENGAPEKPEHSGRAHLAPAHPAPEPPLTGSFTVQGFQLSGDGLSEPIRIPKLLLEPAPAFANRPSGSSQVLAATAAIPAGGAAPLTVSTRLALSGYQVTVRGQASIARARELAQVAGLANTDALNALTGDPVSVDLTAEGPWMPAERIPFGAPPPSSDNLTGTVTLRNANWKADYLVNRVEISQATLHLASDEFRWDPVVFSYGPLKGTASLTLPTACEAPQTCPPTFQVQFGALDARLLQTAFLGAEKRGTLLSTLLDRLRPSVAPAWPQLEGTIKAESLLLGPVTLHEPVASVRTIAGGAEITGFDAGLLGGRIHGGGTFHTAATPKDKPSYTLQGQFEQLHPQAVGQLLGLRASGSSFDGNGKLALTGFTGDDLAASAKGTLHFEWQRGTLAASGSVPAPSALAHFDRWTADAEIANGSLTLKESQARRGASIEPVEGSVPLAIPPKIAFPAPKQTPAKH
jgi:uncharacterized protein involved in outer membrane biogenesis